MSSAIYLSEFPERNTKGERGNSLRGTDKGREQRKLSVSIPSAEFKRRAGRNSLRGTDKRRGQGNLSVCLERRALSQAVFSFVLVRSFLLSLDRKSTLHFRTREPEELL